MRQACGASWSLAVAGGTGIAYWSRGQNVATSARESEGVCLVSRSVAHPDGAQYVPQYCLLSKFGSICSAERTSTTMRIGTASDGTGTIADRDFWFTVH